MKQMKAFGLKEICSTSDWVPPAGEGDLWKAADETVPGLWIGNMQVVDYMIKQTVGSQGVSLWDLAARLQIRRIDTAFFNPIYKWWDGIMPGGCE